jgi:N-acetylglucosaminyl-diphospho-decaprenol L-rhamnosyltransferase
VSGAFDVVIVNWNAGDQLRRCVASVLRYDAAEVARIVVVDNGSIDGSVAGLPDDPRLELVQPGANLGFGRACNLGAARGRARFILFLNPDTMLLRSSLGDVRAFFDSAAGRAFGVCGVRLLDQAGETARHGSTFPRARTFFYLSSGLAKLAPCRFPPLEMIEFDHRHSRPVDHVMGAFYCIRRPLFEALGGFDERFFVYYEDLDLSLRAAAAGQGCFYLADVSVFHRGGGTSDGAKAKALSYILESRLRFARKHFGIGGTALAVVSTLFIDPVSRLAFAAALGSRRGITEVLHGHGRLWRSLLGGRVDRD